jgi:thiol-disulfide isomerase/thioredoxin
MHRPIPIAILAAAALCGQTTTLALRVRDTVLAGDINGAQRFLTQVRAATGVTPQYLEALAWIGRGYLNAKDFNDADKNADEVRTQCLAQLTKRKLDAEPALPTALGAAIEVHALAAAAEGRRDESVVFLRQELKHWYATSIRARIQKNLNLLTLEGKPAPPLVVAQSVTARKPAPLALHRGHPVLLFFWAHWCSDCKREIAIIQRLEQVYGPRGLQVIAPTQHYGYIAGGQDAPPAVETNYIKAVFDQYYSALGNIEVPLSEENFASYGVSTTPTIVLLDSQGIVRLYNPGNISYDQLAAKLVPLLHAS